MTDSPNLGLPYLEAAQAQKHVTHNEAMRRLDALAQAVVLERTLTSPPGSSADGDSYIPASGATGAWSGHANEIASWQDGAWMFYPPSEGWRVWSAAEDALIAWNGTAWTIIGGAALLNPTSLVGVNSTANTSNRLSVASPATLLNHEGAGHQLKLNKNASTDTASLLYQTGFEGRAEMGTTGDDDFHVKVSADGTAWNEAIVVDRATGAVSFPNSSFPGGANLTTAYAATTVAINSDSGTDATVNAFTTANAGVAPASGGGTANFLRADGSWAAPSGGGGVSDGDKGDITVSGSGTVWDIDANTVTNAKAADVPTATFKGRTTAATGDPEDLTVAQAKTLLNLTGTNSGDQTITLTSDVTGSGTGSFAVAIANNAVTNVKAADMAANTLKGNNTGGAADPADLSVAQVKTLLAYTTGDIGAQPSDATLTALAAFNTNGLLTQTAADTFAARTLTGTANQVDVANGSGVAGNPTLTLASTLVVPGTAQFPQNGLLLRDTDNTHNLAVNAGSNLTAARTLTLTTATPTGR